MYGIPIYGKSGFLQHFGKRGMRVDRPSQILGTATVFHVGHSLADQFGGIATQNLHAEDAVAVVFEGMRSVKFACV